MPQDRLQKLFDVMSSQTKSHIIALLSIGGKMTVTQISKHINTSRSNLYQAISDLQEQGFVNQPDIVVRKNYVEKYYLLNDSAFNQTTAGEINEEFMKMSPDKLRNLMATFLLSQSLNLRVIAQEILNVSDEHFLTGVEKLKPYMDYIDNPENFRSEDTREKTDVEHNMILVMTIPDYLLKSLRKVK